MVTKPRTITLSATVAGLTAITFAGCTAWASPTDSPPTSATTSAQHAALEERFEHLVEERLPGVFEVSEASVPLSFFAKTNCGALEYVDSPHLAADHGVQADVLYGGTPSQTKAALVDRWAERIGTENAYTFVTISIDTFCPWLMKETNE